MASNESNSVDTAHTPDVSETEDGITSANSIPNHDNIRKVSATQQTQEDEYDISSCGLFVIINNNTFNHKCDGGNWKGLNYTPDVDSLREVFNLYQMPDNHQGVPTNLKLHSDLHRTSGKKEEKSEEFDHFMKKEVLGYEGEASFLMFFLMSHGLENGDFLLSQNAETGDCCRFTFGHKRKDKCFIRNIYTDVIEKIQDCKTFHGKPKVFVIQACRGDKLGVVDNSKGGPEPDVDDPKRYIPHGSDTFVYVSCIEGQMSYVGSGSFLIQNFCKTLEQLWAANQKLRSLDDILEGKADREAKKKEIENNHEVQEAQWLKSVCRKVTAKVSQDLLEYQKKKKTVALDKQQPEIKHDTLRRKLSMVEIMKCQGRV